MSDTAQSQVPSEDSPIGDPTATDHSAPAQSAKKSRVIWWLVGAAALVLVAAAAFVLVFVIGSGRASAGVVATEIADLETTPERAWQYRYTAGSQEYASAFPNVAAAGSDAFLVWSDFDYWAWTDANVDSRWYDGYERHYNAGYDVGEAFWRAEAEYNEIYDEWRANYEADLDAWQDRSEAMWDAWYADWTGTVAFPDPGPEPAYDPPAGEHWSDAWWRDTLFATDLTADEAETAFAAGGDSFPGFSDGYQDAEDGNPRGTNAAAAPAQPNWRGELALVELETGEERWTTRVTDAVDDTDLRRPFTVTYVEQADIIVVAVPLQVDDGADPLTTLLAVSGESGEILSQLDVDGDVVMAQGDGAFFVLAHFPGGSDDGTVMRLNPLELDGEPIWSKSAMGAQTIALLGGNVCAVDPSGGETLLLDPATGERSSWGRDFWIELDNGEGVLYEPVGESLVRMELKDVYIVAGWVDPNGLGVFQLMSAPNGYIDMRGVDREGERTWDRSVEAGSFLSDGTRNLLVADVNREGTLLEDLVRIDPRTGERVWERPYGDAISQFVMFHSDVAIALDEEWERLVVIDLETGEERYTQRAPGDPSYSGGYRDGFWSSENYYYFAVDGRLLAYSATQPGSVWTMRYDPDEEMIQRVGDRLMLVNVERGTIALLS